MGWVRGLVARRSRPRHLGRVIKWVRGCVMGWVIGWVRGLEG